MCKDSLLFNLNFVLTLFFVVVAHLSLTYLFPVTIYLYDIMIYLVGEAAPKLRLNYSIRFKYFIIINFKIAISSFDFEARVRIQVHLFSFGEGLWL